MYNTVTFEEIISKKNTEIIIDCIYEGKRPFINKSCEVLSKLMGVKNSGGFRPIGSYKNYFDIKYIVLYSTNSDVYWQDKLDEELGLYIYYGDNQVAGNKINKTKLGGNLMLEKIFELASSSNAEDRKKIPPIFLFEKINLYDVKFSGLLVPGYKGINSKEWLTAIWAKRNDGGRFQNYKSLFTILNTDEGSEIKPNDSSISLRWIDDLKLGKGYESVYAPKSWKRYIDKRKFLPLEIKAEPKIRNKMEQLPSEKIKLEMLKIIYEYFKDDTYLFESFAILITTLADNNILNCENTRPTRDGGRDGIGEYRIMNNLSVSLKTVFAIEAKCKKIQNSVGVKETSRLLSRIRHRQFGVFVTTSYVASQAYQEIIEDEQPIAIISGKDIIDILFQNEITNKEMLMEYLDNNFKKTIN